MEKLTGKMVLKDFIIAILIVAFLFGIYFYINYKISSVSKELVETNKKMAALDTEIRDSLKRIEDSFNGTQANINNVLQTEQQKNSSLMEQFNEINNTVGALSKLSKIDPELLKKYSKIYFLNEHYVPASLVDIDKMYLSTKSVNSQILTEVMPHLKAMIDASVLEGKELQVLSAYRSFKTQSILKANYKMTYGTTAANRFSADQGYSEHQLGTTLDLNTKKLDASLEGFDKTEEYKWLNENAYKYGFILSYPKGNTYYKFEPWHWRYVGVALATKLHEKDMHFYDMEQREIDTYLANIFD